MQCRDRGRDRLRRALLHFAFIVSLSPRSPLTLLSLLLRLTYCWFRAGPFCAEEPWRRLAFAKYQKQSVARTNLYLPTLVGFGGPAVLHGCQLLHLVGLCFTIHQLGCCLALAATGRVGCQGMHGESLKMRPL